jgi:hypothetical protein
MLRAILGLIPICLFGSAVLATAGMTYSGRTNQLEVSIPRLEAAVQVDGVLDEAAWSQAARLTDFSQYAPTDGRSAEHETEVLVWYSATAVHFGIRRPAGRARSHRPQP